MATYRTLWLSICVPLGVIGASLAVSASPAAAMYLVVVFGLVGSLLTVCLVGAFWEAGTRGRLWLLVRGALLTGISVGAFLAYVSLLGSGALLLVAVVVASCPYVVTTSARWIRTVRTPSVADLDAVARAFAYASPELAQFQPPPGLRDLTDAQLCRRWRASYRATRRRMSAAQLIAAVAERQMYLDELERRNARGFAAWVAAGPEVADNPLPYLTSAHIDSPAVDWDELTRGPG